MKNSKFKRWTLAVLVLVVLLLFYRGCTRNQSQNELVTEGEVTNTDTIGFKEVSEPIDVEPIVAEKPTFNASKKPIQGEWFIKNDVTKVKDIAIEDIADEIVVKPIVSDEPIGSIRRIDGVSNDFIAGDGHCTTFYHIKDGRLVEKLYAVGRGPGEYPTQLVDFAYLSADSLFYGYELNIGQIMCYKTSPFKFDSKFDIKRFAENKHFEDMIVLGRDRILLTFKQLQPDHSYVYGKCAVYEFDGHSIKKKERGTAECSRITTQLCLSWAAAKASTQWVWPVCFPIRISLVLTLKARASGREPNRRILSRCGMWLSCGLASRLSRPFLRRARG